MSRQPIRWLKPIAGLILLFSGIPFLFSLFVPQTRLEAWSHEFEPGSLLHVVIVVFRDYGEQLLGILFLSSILVIALNSVIGLESGFWKTLRKCWSNVPGRLRMIGVIVLVFFVAVNTDYLVRVLIEGHHTAHAISRYYVEVVSRHVQSLIVGLPLFVYNAACMVVVGGLLIFGHLRRPDWEKQPCAESSTLKIGTDSLILAPSLVSQPLIRKAELLVERGKLARAARCFEKAGEGFCYRAGSLYEKCELHDRAARAFEKAGQYYRRKGNYKRAGDAFFYAGVWDAAADAYAKVLVSQRSTHDHTRLLETVRRLGEAQFRLGRYEEAGTLYEKYGLHARAGECFEKAGLETRAAEAYARAGDSESSARAFEAGGRPDLAGLERAKALMSRGEFESAAEAFAKVERHDLAAQAYLRAGRISKAATCHVRKGEFARAAELYLEAGDHEGAMDCYVKLGQFGHAASLAAHLGLQDRQAEYYELDGQYLAAARSYLMIGDRNRAGTCFGAQRFKDPEEVKASIKILSILEQQDRREDCQILIQALTVHHRPNPGNAELFEAAATILSRFGEVKSAAELCIQAARQTPENRERIKLAMDLASRAGLRVKIEMPREAPPATPSPAVVSNTADTDIQDAELSEADHTLTLDEQSMLDLTQDGELERYQMVQELGRGGMGMVYKAHDRRLDRLVAFKMLHPEFNKDPQVVLFFKREAQAIAKLNHPNVVTLYDVGDKKGCFFMVMEYVEGMTMERLSRKYPQYIRQNLLGLLYETCCGLHYAHQKGIIHRDLKPSNIMVTRDGRVKIMDFGLAKKTTDPSQTLQIWGTPVFMAPEVLQGTKATFQSDIYSLGVTLYYLITRKLPFNEEDVNEKFVGDGLPTRPEVLSPDISPELSDTIMKCLYLEPMQRYRDVNELSTVVKLLSQRKTRLFVSGVRA